MVSSFPSQHNPQSYPWPRPNRAETRLQCQLKVSSGAGEGGGSVPLGTLSPADLLQFRGSPWWSPPQQTPYSSPLSSQSFRVLLYTFMLRRLVPRDVMCRGWLY